MNKNVRKLISEAFNEVYENMFLENSSKLGEKLSPENKALAERLIENVKTLGAASTLNHSYDDSEKSDTKTNILNYVTERLIEDYRNSKDPKIGEWLKSSFYPTEGTKFYNYLQKKWDSKGKEEIQDAALNAYEQIMLAPGALDTLLNSYKDGSGKFGGLVLSSIVKRMDNYFKGYAGTGGKDIFSGGETSSGDSEDEETGKSMFDKIGASGGMQDDFVDPEDISKMKEIQAAVLGWLKNNVSEKQYIAWRELTSGSTPGQIAEDYPELFKTNKDVSRNFSQLVSSPKAQEVSELISHAFGINWNMSDVKPKALQQTYSMDPSFGDKEFTKRSKVSTPEMEAAQENLKNVMASIGLKPAQFNSEVKIEKITSELRDKGEIERADEIENAVDNLNKATEKAKSRGQYDVQMPYIPSSEEEEADVAKLFEGVDIKGVDIDALIERVMRRIHK